MVSTTQVGQGCDLFISTFLPRFSGQYSDLLLQGLTSGITDIFCCLLASNSSTQLMGNDLLGSVSINAMPLPKGLFVLLHLGLQDLSRQCIVIIFCLFFLIWCEHQRHTFHLLALRPVRLDLLGAVKLLAIAYLLYISATWLWTTGIEFSILLNAVGWLLSTNASAAGNIFLFRSGPRGQGR